MALARMRVEVVSAGCVIEPMCEHDLLEVVEIEESTGLSQWGWEAYRAELEKPEALMLVARRLAPEEQSGRHLSGYIAARITAGELHVNNIGVWPEARRRGVGGALLGTVLELAARRGAHEAILEVRASNLPARAMYERLGFEVVGERKRYYKGPVEDAKIMTRRLAPTA
jgi:ribosomal-protein-alanine N-acetyltransferase